MLVKTPRMNVQAESDRRGFIGNKCMRKHSDSTRAIVLNVKSPTHRSEAAVNCKSSSLVNLKFLQAPLSDDGDSSDASTNSTFEPLSSSEEDSAASRTTSENDDTENVANLNASSSNLSLDHSFDPRGRHCHGANQNLHKPGGMSLVFEPAQLQSFPMASHTPYRYREEAM